MGKPAAVDAHCMNYFQKERIGGLSGEATVAISHILDNGHIALDEEQHCYQEWLDSAQGPAHLNLQDWVAEKLVEGKIKFYKVTRIADVRKSLNKLGLPSKDHKWLHLASSCRPSVLVSEDSDLYEPASKLWPRAQKEKIKSEQKGCVCKYAKSELEVEVMRLCHVPVKY